jgi:hypothetical protein
MAPEILDDNPIYTKAGDVFAFAVLMNEVMSERVPWEARSIVQVIRAVCDRKERPPVFTAPADLSADLCIEMQSLVVAGASHVRTSEYGASTRFAIS